MSNFSFSEEGPLFQPGLYWVKEKYLVSCPVLFHGVIGSQKLFSLGPNQTSSVQHRGKASFIGDSPAQAIFQVSRYGLEYGFGVGSSGVNFLRIFHSSCSVLSASVKSGTRITLVGGDIVCLCPTSVRARSVIMDVAGVAGVHVPLEGCTEGHSKNPNDLSAVTRVRKLLFRRMLVGVNDGRFFMGNFHCMDKQGNILLQDAVEFRSVRRSSPSPMEQRGLGLILIPSSCRTSCHIDCSVEEQLSLLSLQNK